MAPNVPDCVAALQQLPEGSRPIPWYQHESAGRHHIFPITARHGKLIRVARVTAKINRIVPNNPTHIRADFNGH